MLQTHTDFDQAESERLQQAADEIDRLTQVLKDIHLVAHRFEWGNYSFDSARGYVYRRVREGLDVPSF